MSSNDCDAQINFSLVLTYIPALLMLLRVACMLAIVAILQTFTSVSPPVLVCSVLLLAYIDWFCFRLDRLSKACGFLAPLALALLANGSFYHTDACAPTTMLNTLYYANSIVWATSSSYVFINQMLQLKYPVNDLAVAVVWCVNCILHLVVHCDYDRLWLVVCRVAIFYPMTIAHWFAQVLLSDCDRNRFAFTVLHTALHVLFVDLYVATASVLIFVSVLCYCMHSTATAAAKPAKITASLFTQNTDVEKAPENMSALLHELRAAKQRAQTADQPH